MLDSAHGADALAAARCAWGAGGSLGQRPNVPEGGEMLVKSNVHLFVKFNRHYDTLIILAF